VERALTQYGWAQVAKLANSPGDVSARLAMATQQRNLAYEKNPALVPSMPSELGPPPAPTAPPPAPTDATTLPSPEPTATDATTTPAVDPTAPPAPVEGAPTAPAVPGAAGAPTAPAAAGAAAGTAIASAVGTEDAANQAVRRALISFFQALKQGDPSNIMNATVVEAGEEDNLVQYGRLYTDTSRFVELMKTKLNATVQNAELPDPEAAIATAPIEIVGNDAFAINPLSGQRSKMAVKHEGTWKAFYGAPANPAEKAARDRVGETVNAMGDLIDRLELGTIKADEAVTAYKAALQKLRPPAAAAPRGGAPIAPQRGGGAAPIVPQRRG
jgi:hypothetical protein